MLQRYFWSVLISIISSSTLSLGKWTLKENNSVSNESILSVHTPIVKLTSCIEFSYGTFIFLAFAFSNISNFPNWNIVSVPGGSNLKSAFLVVGLVPPTLINKPATEDCQSNSTIIESWGSHTS